MKNNIKRWFNVVVLLMAGSTSALAQNFAVVPKFPKEGDTATFVYDARKTSLKDAKSITGRYVGYQDFRWIQDEMKFAKRDSVWTARFVLPEKMSFMLFTFHSDNAEDRGGDLPYGYIFTSKEGPQLPGGMLAWGMIRAPHMIKGTPYVVDTAAYITEELMMFWIKNELKYHPQNRMKVLYPAISVLKYQNTTESLQKAYGELDALQQIPDLSESDWIEILRVYREVLNDSTKTQDIENEIRTRFPNGKYVSDQNRLADFMLMRNAKDDQQRYAYAKAFIDKHPYREEDAAFNDANRIKYTDVYWIISVYASMQKDLETYRKYISTAAPYESLWQVIYRTISVPYETQNTMSAEEILPYLRVVLERVNYYKDNFEGDRFSQIYYANAALFAKVLAANKLYEEAFVYASAAQHTKKFEDADLNDTYVRILEGLRKDKELQDALEKSYALNQSSAYMLDLMKQKFVKRTGSESGYDQYLASLRDVDKTTELKNKVQKMLIDKDFPDFTLYDQYGNLVRLSEQKGKVVVLDFWASWCAPCKAAFPGMKLAVEHFQNDPSVVFYFVDTQERKTDMREYVVQYMEEHDYPFTVLLDADSKVSKAAGVTAIPHKMVIGPNGRLRFSEVGYMGSASELSDEIIEMVNMLKETK